MPMLHHSMNTTLDKVCSELRHDLWLEYYVVSRAIGVGEGGGESLSQCTFK